MPGIPLYQIDAFTNVPFAGNPAAVCVLEQDTDERWMQSVAAEMNLAETAFVRRDGDDYRLRWFTPEVEVDLCGHATLATAHALWTEGFANESTSLRFHTRSGVLECCRQGDTIEMDFPALPVSEVSPRADLLAALGTRAVWTGRSKFDDLVLVDSPATVRAVRPDFRALAGVTERGVIVTAHSDDSRADFLSRFFAPRVGIDEDPVTGSAHCCLGPFWAARLGRPVVTGFQASRRGGWVGVRVLGERVVLRGQAVTVLRGELSAVQPS